MTRRVTKLEAAAELDVSTSTIDRMIQRNELSIEKEPHGSRYKVWILLADEPSDKSTERSGEDSGDSADEPSHLLELTTLRERVRNLESLDVYHREQLKESELRFQQLLQQLDTSQRTLETFTRALPAPEEASNSSTRWNWWPFRKAVAN